MVPTSHDLTAHFDVFPTLFDLCGLPSREPMDFDGRSFKTQLYDPENVLPQRTLFAEFQRNYKPAPWENTVGMTTQWRLVNNTELYDIKKDPGQKTNVIEDHPEVAEQIRAAHKEYWKHVTPGDRTKPRFIVGHPHDPETFLHSSDWYLPYTPWNHGLTSKAMPEAGSWDIHIDKEGTYRFEVRRWPREAKACHSRRSEIH
jgi:hypothetical protein